jgi:hypothetical protein
MSQLEEAIFWAAACIFMIALRAYEIHHENKRNK